MVWTVIKDDGIQGLTDDTRNEALHILLLGPLCDFAIQDAMI